MDVAIVMTATQQFLAWILLGLLLTWMVTFMLLALRPTEKKKVSTQDLAGATGSLPATTAPLRVLATQPARHTEHSAMPAVHVQSHAGLINREAVGDRGAAHLAQ